MWVLSILLSQRPATTMPATKASTRTAATPIFPLRDFISALLGRIPVVSRWAGPRRGQGDRPATASARGPKRDRAAGALAGPAADLPAALVVAARGTGNNQ